MKIDTYKYILYLTCITLFLPAFALPIVINKFCITVYFVLLLFCIFYCILFHSNYLIKKTISFTKLKATKFLLAYFVFLVLISLVHLCLGHISLVASVLSLIIRFICIFLPFFVGFLFIKYLKRKKIFKFIYVILWVILLWGVLDFVAFYFDIDILKSIFNFFVNRRLIIKNVDELKAMSNFMPRIQSVFEEPCHLGAFIAAFLPFIYKISFSNIKIIPNNFLNKLVKIAMPFIVWFEIICTFSPIYLIINIAITVFYVLYENGIRIKFNLKNLFVLIFLLSTIYLIYYNFINADLTNAVLLRIQSVLRAITDINILILAEQSLGRRLIDIINESILFINNTLLGVGPGNLGKALATQLQKSPVIIVPEVNIALMKSPNYYLPTPNIFFMNLAESGMVGVSLLYAFFISIYKSISRVLKYTSGSAYLFAYGLKYFVLIYIILSFYDSQLTFPYGLVMFGIALGFVHNLRMGR